MGAEFLAVKNIYNPEILISEKDFLIAFKPPRMHSSSSKTEAITDGGSGETFLEWCTKEYPEIADLPGRRPGDGGLIHRLDYDTQGLLMLARTKAGMDAILEQQKEGSIIKEYSALVLKNEVVLPGFPPKKPELPDWVFSGGSGEGDSALICSAFRPYGPGRKSVRPVPLDVVRSEKFAAKKKKHDIALNADEPYITEILKARFLSADVVSFRLMISKGFRHQIRSHLFWIGLPILNDDLYGGSPYGKGFLGLRACSISFMDPSSKDKRKYSIPPLEPEMI